jgi:acyl-CoA synthetase (AMP-forming)/AMP-acid ligase II
MMGEQHSYIADMAASISRGPPLAGEAGLGELTLSGFIREVTARHPEREALVSQRPDGTLERWTYRQLWERTQEVARALTALGLGKGERVGVLMTNRSEFITATFGTALAGGVPALLSTFSTPSELEYMLASSACSVLLIERHVLTKDFAQMLCGIEPAIARAPLASMKFPYLRHLAMVDGGEALGAIENWDSFLARGAGVAQACIDARASGVTPADPGGLFFSSGSTGKPKGILSAHRGIAIQCWRMAPQQGLAQDVRYWTANSFTWSGNFSMALGAPLAAGCTLVLQRTFDPKEALRLMEVERVDFLFAWPHQWAQLIDAPNWLETDLSALKYIDVESSITRHPSVKTSWIQPSHCYGNTETFTLSTAYPAGTTREVAANSHGLPLPGNSVKIVEPLTGAVVAVGERGEIAIKGPTLMKGYLGTPLDQSTDNEGYFRTGDGGYLDEHGRLFWEGRLNDIIKTGGANVSPVEVDDVLESCPGVKVTKTVGVPDELLGEVVVTCIVPQDGVCLSEAEVRSYARRYLASYKVPRRVLFFDSAALQSTGSAKIKTAELRELAAQRLATQDGEPD